MSAQRTPASAPPNAGLTRWTVTAITLLIAALSFAFCFGNAHRLCISLGIEGWIAWLIGPSVDLSVVGLLLGVRYLALLGYSDGQLSKPRRLLILCGLLTLALNTADAITRGRYGTAAVDAIGPVLLICWADVGPWLLRQIHTPLAQDEADPVLQSADAQQDESPLPLAGFAREASAEGEHADNLRAAPQPPEQHEQRSAGGRDEAGLWARALRLDAAHRAERGRPITRDALREALSIGTDKATELNRRLRQHTARLAAQDGPVPADPPQDAAAVLVPAGTRA
ncbi:MAG TPA: DUF2637 domain-containing protein [Actinocrinis sp.]|uniref:DUF2637 domain-containing protein n=1 Tax=Actinocrinis sp. TaxID=1920516 RepID=UPI002DDCA4D1|nr:DUF2637 domain-containing protein [Actinocrinis sp.]HEV2347038.1 DUF2637 domain-containing protein [Actinocrinis sp.]